jgi:tetratricopeptide (TPR) repeat protein
MLELIREYGRERLEACGQLELVRWLHAEYYLTLAQEAESELLGTRQVTWLRRLEPEYDNLRSALEWVSERGSVEQSLRLAWALWPVWFGRGAFAEARRWLAALLSRQDASPPTLLRARLLIGAGRLAYEQGDYAEARQLSEESLAVARAVGDRATIAAILTTLGHLARGEADYPAARRFHGESLALRRAMGDRWGVAVSLKSLGHVALDQDDHASARRLYEQSLEIDRALEHSWETALTLQKLGEIAHDRSDFAAARAYYEESLLIAADLPDRRLVAGALEGFAALAASRGDPTSAARLAGSAAALRDMIGAPHVPSEHARIQRRLEPARRALGERSYDELCVTGRRVAMQQAIALALETAEALVQDPGVSPGDVARRAPTDGNGRAPSPDADAKWPRSSPAA